MVRGIVSNRWILRKWKGPVPQPYRHRASGTATQPQLKVGRLNGGGLPSPKARKGNNSTKWIYSKENENIIEDYGA
jgi:hypothetical protein